MKKKSMNKICKKCNQSVDIADFYASEHTKDGYRNECIKCRKKYERDRYLGDRERFIKRAKQWRLNNPGYRSTYELNRKKTDIQFRITKMLRERLNKALRRNYKTGSSIKDLGCSIESFKKYIESLWTDGMNWDNYGKKSGQWSIDHKLPLSRVDLTDRKQFLKVCHYTNLQPMWHIRNMEKGNKII